MSASLWSILAFSTRDSFNLMVSGHCRMLLSSSSIVIFLYVWLTVHYCFSFLSGLWIHVAERQSPHLVRNRLLFTPSSFFPPLNGMHISNWRKPSLRRILLVHKGLPTSSPAIPLHGSKKETLYQLFFPWHRRGKPWQKPDNLQTCDTACQRSGSIQSIYCIRGHFHGLFLSHIADIAGILTLSYCYILLTVKIQLPMYSQSLRWCEVLFKKNTFHIQGFGRQSCFKLHKFLNVW